MIWLINLDANANHLVGCDAEYNEVVVSVVLPPKFLHNLGINFTEKRNLDEEK